MFTPSQIKSRVRVQPFKPFRVVTSSGESYVVTHPDLIWVGVRDVHIGIASRKDPSTYDDETRVSLLHVTALEDVSPSKPKKNGQ